MKQLMTIDYINLLSKQCPEFDEEKFMADWPKLKSDYPDQTIRLCIIQERFEKEPRLWRSRSKVLKSTPIEVLNGYTDSR